MNTLDTQAGAIVQYAPRTLPSNTSLHGLYFSHDGIGGYVELPNITYRNDIPIGEEMNSDGMSSGRRKLGMIVYTALEKKFFQANLKWIAGVASNLKHKVRSSERRERLL